jgi:outer membrane OprD family porin
LRSGSPARCHPTRLLITGAGIVLLLLSLASRGWAQEEISEEGPPPASVEQSVSPIERSFERPKLLRPERPRLFPGIRERLKDAPAFFRDMQVDVNLRSYYLNAGNFGGARNEGEAIGGALSFKSGWLLDRLSVGGVFYTSQPLYAPASRDGTVLFEENRDGYSVLGQFYARLRVVDVLFLNLYRYQYDTPYMSLNDNRMTPNTFEGYTFTGKMGGADGGPGLRYGGGYITKMKARNDDDFVWMSRVAGASVDRGVGVLGAMFSWGGLSIGGIDYYSEDIINIAYGETTYTTPLVGGLGLLVAAQYTDQRSVGGDLMLGRSFWTNQFGVKTELSYGGGVLTFAYTRDASGADIQTPWSGTPGYTSVMVQSFKGAGQEAFLAKGSYHFAPLGLPGLTAYAVFVHGWAQVSPVTKAPVPNVNEADVDIQWRPEWSALKGLWFRARYAHVKQYEGPKEATNQYRIIVNYDFSLF